MSTPMFGRRARSYLWCEGDSYMNGSLGVNLKDGIAAAASMPVTNTSVGGSTMTDVLTRITANPDLVRQCRLIIWDGNNNGMTSVAEELAVIDQILAITGAGIVFLPPVAPGPSSSSDITTATQELIDVYAGLVSRGVATFDPIDVLSPLNDGSAQDLQDVAAHVIPSSLRQGVGNIHIGSAGITAIASAINDLLVSSGWDVS